MSKGSSFGKSLKGIGSLSAKLLGPIQNSIESAIASGGVELTSVQISGGTIDGVVIGDGQPGPGTFTTLYSGSAQGEGFNVCFYGTRVGDEACWEPTLGLWEIQGDLFVRDISDLGNIRIAGNTISATNPGGSINLIPSSGGILSVFSGITQSTATQDISFNTGTGNFSANANISNLISNNLLNLKTKQGNISVYAGYQPTYKTITNIPVTTSGGITTVTTSSAHSYTVGTKVKLVTPNSLVNGYYTVLSTPTPTTFTVQLPTGVPVSSTISSGTSEIESDILLTAKDFINLDTPSFSTTSSLVNISAAPSATDRGVTFLYSDSGTKSGFYGWDTSANNFTFLTNTTNTDGVISGTPANLRVGSITINGDITVTGAAVFPHSTLTGLLNDDHTQYALLAGRSGGQILTGGNSNGNNLIFRSTSSATKGSVFFDETTASISNSTGAVLLSGGIGISNTTDATSYTNGGTFTTAGGLSVAKKAYVGTDLYVGGNIIVAGTINGNAPGSGTGSGNTTERISVSTGSPLSPTANTNITFVNASGSGTITGTLLAPSTDGFLKIISVNTLPSGTIYQLTCPSGILLDPGSGTTTSKTLKFDTPGQSIQLVWDNTKALYTIVNSGCYII